jgi:uncharacterized membrane protein YedE/YeeE
MTNAFPTEFTPWTAALGGLLIGLAASGLLLSNGRIAGVSGICGRLLAPSAADRGWRLCFLAGLPLGALAVGTLRGGLPVQIVASPVALVVAGLLVGFGTQLGNGCTSGHGVCGLARGSRRSLVATLTFMASAAITVFLARHVVGG